MTQHDAKLDAVNRVDAVKYSEVPVASNFFSSVNERTVCKDLANITWF